MTMIARGFKTRCENISVQMRESLQLTESDPLSPIKLAEHLEVLLWEPGEIEGLSAQNKILLLGKGKNNWSAVTISFPGIDVIIYNPSHSRARQSSDIMHELSHLMLHHTPSQIVVSPENPYSLRSYNQLQEEEADWLSGCLLVPREVLVYIIRKRMPRRQACEIYGVSNQLLTYRINITGVNRQYK